MGTLEQKSPAPLANDETVSIQLMSPASGDSIFELLYRTRFNVSIQLMSPASGDFSANDGDDLV